LDEWVSPGRRVRSQPDPAKSERIPKNSTSRIFLDVNPLAGNQLGVEVKQGATAFSQSCLGDTRITMVVVTAP
jgi:hypothetical protein